MSSHVIIKVYVCIVLKLRIELTAPSPFKPWLLEALYRDKIKFLVAKNIAQLELYGTIDYEIEIVKKFIILINLTILVKLYALLTLLV